MIGIGDYDGKSRNTRKVRTREDQVMFCGKKYRRDKKTRLLLMHHWRTKASTRGYMGA